MNSAGERLYNGLIKENPTFVLMLGMCPTLAVTTSAMNGLGMGLTTMVVLALSNMLISLLRKIIPNRVRIPAFIVIIASFVTIVQLLLEAYLPELNKSLGVYIPLIVVNCIILGRAESYAYFNPPVASLFDGIGMGLGFTLGLTCIGVFREILGAGELFGFAIMPESFEPIRIFGLAPGAFFVLAMLVAFQNYIKTKREKAGKDASKIGSGCSEDCMNCGQEGCAKRFYDNSADADKMSTETVAVAEAEKEVAKEVIEKKSIKEETAKKEAAQNDTAIKEQSTVEKAAEKNAVVEAEAPARNAEAVEATDKPAPAKSSGTKQSGNRSGSGKTGKNSNTKKNSNAKKKSGNAPKKETEPKRETESEKDADGIEFEALDAENDKKEEK